MSTGDDTLLLLSGRASHTRPPAPTRMDAITIRQRFQGLTVVTPTYGPLPWFEPAFAWMPTQADRDAVKAAKHAVGDRHIGITVSGWYHSAPAEMPYNQMDGRDFTKDWPALIAVLAEIVESGFLVDLRLAGDGQSVSGGGYNDPAGGTYGYATMMRYMPGLVDALGLAGLLPYTVLTPGYDGVFGPDGPWSPAQCRAWMRLARLLVLDDGYLGFQFAYPYCHWGGGRADYDDPDFAMLVDVFLTEYEKNLVGSTAFWEHGARMLGPVYRKPFDQPADFDSDAPYGPDSGRFYLAGESPRGPRLFIPYEFGLYEFVRDRNTAIYIDQQRAYAHGAGALVTG